MSDYKKEIMEEVLPIIQEIYATGYDQGYHEANKENISIFLPKWQEWLSQALTRVEEAARKEDIDFLEEKGYLVATEFIREHFISPSEEKEVVNNEVKVGNKVVKSEEKECKCICHKEGKDDYHNVGSARVDCHCSPKKEKRGRNRLFGSIKEG